MKDGIKAKLLDRIKFEVADNAFSNFHGLTSQNWEKGLMEPSCRSYSRTWDSEINNYWVVFDEIPDDIVHGYQVVYDEQTDLFGLAVKGSIGFEGKGTVIGFYGSFLDAIENM